MKKQSMKERYKEHAGEERAEHGYHKAKSKKKSFEKFKEKKEHSPKKRKGKVEKVMHEFKEGALHSGSKKGPVVSNPKQAVAIALSEARKAGAKIPKKRGKIAKKARAAMKKRKQDLC